MRATMTMVGAVLAASLFACGGEASDDLEGTSFEEGKEDSARARLAGAYTGAGARRSQLAWLELRRDGSFAAGEVVICAVAPCHPARLEGSFTTRLGSLYLTHRRGRIRYDYTLHQEANGTKRLLLTRDGVTQTMRSSR